MVVSVEEQKRLSAENAIDEMLRLLDLDKESKVIGIGSGSTIIPAVSYLARSLSERKIRKDVLVCVPTSYQAQQLILEQGLRLGTLAQYCKLDFAIDGADEVDESLNVIKGGGGCLTQEKLVAFAAKTFFVIIHEEKHNRKLFSTWKRGLPVEIIRDSYQIVQHAIKRIYNKSRCELRMASAKAGKNIIDITFRSRSNR